MTLPSNSNAAIPFLWKGKTTLVYFVFAGGESKHKDNYYRIADACELITLVPKVTLYVGVMLII